MGNSNWCVDCNKTLRGNSFKYGLCYICRQESLNKLYCSRIDAGQHVSRKKLAELYPELDNIGGV